MDRDSFWQEVITMAKRQRPNPVEELPKEQMAQLESNVYDHIETLFSDCLLYTSPSPRDKRQSRMPSSA